MIEALETNNKELQHSIAGRIKSNTRVAVTLLVKKSMYNIKMLKFKDVCLNNSQDMAIQSYDSHV